MMKIELGNNIVGRIFYRVRRIKFHMFIKFSGFLSIIIIIIRVVIIGIQENFLHLTVMLGTNLQLFRFFFFFQIS